MISLIKNELIKQYYSKRVWLFVVVIVFLGLIQAFILYQDDKDMDYFQTQEGKIEYLQRQISEIDEAIQSIPQSNSENSLEEQRLAEFEIQKKQYQKEIDDLKAYPLYDFNNEQWEAKIDSLLERKKMYPDLGSSFDKLIQIAKMNQDLGVPYDNTNRLNALNFLNEFISSVMSLFLLAGIAFFQADTFSGEFHSGSIRLLVAQPVSRIKIYTAKFLSSFIISLLVITIVQLLMSVLIGVFFGIGDWNYQAIVNHNTIMVNAKFGPDWIPLADTGTQVTYLELVCLGMLNQLMSVLCCTSFVVMLSSFFQSSLPAVGIPIGVSVAWIMVQEMLPQTSAVWPYLFFSYQDGLMNISDPITQLSGFDIAGQLNIDLFHGYVVLALTSLICFLIGLIDFNRRDLTY